MHVLIVDDDQLLLSGMQRVLAWAHPTWRIDFATSGEAALRQLEEAAADRYDVVLSDLRMPGVGGAELLGHVHRASPSTVRVLFSGALDLDRVLGLASTAHRLLPKPVKLERVEAMLASVGELGVACSAAERELLCSELDLMDLAARVAGSTASLAGRNVWRSALGLQAAAAGVTYVAPGSGDLLTSYAQLIPERGLRPAPDSDVETERVLEVVQLAARSAALALQGAAASSLGEHADHGAIAAAAAGLAWIVAAQLPSAHPASDIVRLSAVALSIRGAPAPLVAVLREASHVLQVPPDQPVAGVAYIVADAFARVYAAEPVAA